ncbi:hypothetical protein BCR44DRAFT_39778 [Catenaria anguillulae PL171]|uniref:BRCT domain-containing protein n=1 Tax=Catenaria anguillulae PL171 TaxID=765915 RepID=A0A1Y2HT54_9FUNG|nr:hypothetical protein BCR44DRAFT_39778 [Catenaria anguillulae PL171]
MDVDALPANLRGPLPTHLTSQFTAFEGCVIAVLDNITGDRPYPTLLEDLLAGILDFGGAYRLSLDDVATITHVVPLSGTLDENSQRIVAAQSQSHKLHVVYWQWIMDCINRRRHLSPRMYTIPLPLVPATVPPPLVSANSFDSSRQGTWYSIKDLTPPTKPVFSNRTIYFHSDVPVTQANRLTEIIVANGGVVTYEWPDDLPANSAETIDMFVFRHARSQTFLQAVQLELPVASLLWLFDVIRLQEWSDPLDSLLHFPFPPRKSGAIPNVRLCLTEFNGRDREYCKELMNVLGAQYHSDMDKKTTHLIAARPAGRKYTVATSDGWTKVHTVNYTWLEDSAMYGQLRDTLLPTYSFFVDHAPCVSDPVVGASRTPQWVIDRIVAEARGTVERLQAKRQRELESLAEAAGKDADAGDLAERRAKERGLEQVHRQYSVLRTMSKEERRQVEKTWEMDDGEFEAPEEDQIQETQGQPGSAVGDLSVMEPVGASSRRSKRSRDASSPVPRKFRKQSTETTHGVTDPSATEVIPIDNSPPSFPSVAPASHSTAPSTKVPRAPVPTSRRSARSTPPQRPPTRPPGPKRSDIQNPHVMVSRIDLSDALCRALDACGIPIGNARAPIVGATHLVVDKANFSERFLLGITSAAYIVNSAWLYDSARAGYPVDEANYLLQDAEFQEEMGGLTVAQAQDRLQRGPLLEGKGLCFVSLQQDSKLSASMQKRLARALRATHLPLADLSTWVTRDGPRVPIVLVTEPNAEYLHDHYPFVFNLVVQEMEHVQQGQPNRGVWIYGVDYFTWAIRSGNGIHTPADRVDFVSEGGQAEEPASG